MITPEGAGVGNLAWTSDSRELVFVGTYKAQSGLWRIAADADGRTPPVPLPYAEATWQGLAISVNGGYLAYARRLEDTNVWRSEIEGTRMIGTPSRLISSTQVDADPEFSPDGKRIAFGSTRSGSYQVWVCDADGSNQRQLTYMDAPESGSPRWSPDGSKIAFDSQDDIYTINSDGGPATRMTNDPAFDVVPTWSRDGRWIYFTSDRTGTRQIWKMPSTGGTPVQVTRHGGVNAFESVDGTTLYYAKDVSVRGTWQMPMQGGEEVKVLDSPGPRRWGCMHVVGKGIFFADTVGDTKALKFAIFFYDFATRRTTQVVPLEKPVMNSSRGIAVSPDARQIVWAQYDAIGTDLMLIENFR